VRFAFTSLLFTCFHGDASIVDTSPSSDRFYKSWLVACLNYMGLLQMSLKVRLLLTDKCSAHCAYCHNEGQAQGRAFLSVDTIAAFLDDLYAKNRIPSEIILSGGEPTLHPQVGDVARLCKERGVVVSMNTHGGHPGRLIKALPYLDELKLHIDSFDADEQRLSMGIKLDRSLESIALAKTYPLTLRVNHPLVSVAKTSAFVKRARELQIDCKIIEMFGEDMLSTPLVSMNWDALGYVDQGDGRWSHHDGMHQVFAKRCGRQHNLDETYFVSVSGVRTGLDSDS
jgi:organic radical activating enzyme